ncbi:Uncharacterised protein [BD1-7 clade bacterium]|uniref:Permuted papain-like amidase enzyme, YaeF/YiiX, C92 family n=1 Tax=BD1-7 clade bacterium TaxID=2029982 RepID=A0A5S9QSS8_9GAMM|nr:Uncharacterised protein [BD1-7 clade bacterium]CAA0122545.1 Uncharacterised protein [BD1-7 clade bacterium]
MDLHFNFIYRPFVRWLNQKRPVQSVPLSHFDRIRQEIKPCDVLLVEGRSRVSEVIKLITQSPWSHAALYIGRLHDIEDPRLREIVSTYYDGPLDQQLIIESELGIGTVIRPLNVYAKEHLRICRPKGLLYNDAQDILRYAVSRLGYAYDVRQILDLARFFFPWWIMPRRWRSSLFERNIGMNTKTVCSTMIAEAFNFVQFPILPLVKKDRNNNVQLFRRNPKLCVPSDFDYSPYFEIIKYPFVDYDYHEDYHLLPWQGEANIEDQVSRGSYLPEVETTRDPDAITEEYADTEDDTAKELIANDTDEDRKDG